MFSMFRKHRIYGLLGSVAALGGGLLAGCSSGNAPAKIGTGIQTATGKTPGTTATGKTPGTTATGTQTAGGMGGTTQGPSGAGAGDTPLDPGTEKAVLDAADVQFSSIVNGTADHATRNQQMAAWLQSRPEFAAAGVTSVDSVWGRLKNGHLYVATSTFIPGEDGRAANGRAALPVPTRKIAPTNFPFRRMAQRSHAAASGKRGVMRGRDATSELPHNAQARVLLSLDREFYNPPNDQVAGLLSDYHYNVIQQLATVENLKSVSGDGAFYWGAHGTIGMDDRSQMAYWAVWTATDVTGTNNILYKADLDDGSLVHFSAAYQRSGVGNGVIVRAHYAITTKFIAKYNWSFAPNCFLYMACCYSDYGAIVADMAARSDGSAATYGWSNVVGVLAAWKAGAFAFDRLLGANQVEPKESAPQRPFDAANVYSEMQNKGLDKGGDSCVLIEHDDGAPALAPSIYNMTMSERIQESPLRGKSKLTINGQFGTDEGTVKIGGVEVPIITWAKDKIECEPADLPGPGFAGDVLVISQGRPGNSVPLTQWHGKLTYSIDLLPPQVSNAVSTIVCDVYFRGDVHRFRNQAGEGRNTPGPFDFRAAPGSTCHWAVTGDPPPMATWSGPLSADLPFGLNGTVNPPYGTGFIVSGIVDTGGGAVRLSFNFLNCVTAYAVPGGGSPVATIHDPMLTAQGSGVGSDGYVLYSNNLSATITRDTFIIPGATRTGSTPVFEPKLIWTDFVPTFMPDDDKGEDDGH